MEVFWLISVSGAVLLGAAMGSFAVAQVWRLRARQLIEEKEAGQRVDSKELKKLKPLVVKGVKKDRSRCLSCSHVLAWYDLVPILSWLSLRGKCRYCKSPIGKTEFLTEISMALVFGISVIFWPEPLVGSLEIIKLLVWFGALTILAINFIYDAKWSLLVSGLNWALIILGLIFAVISLFQTQDIIGAIWSLVGAVMILGGLYALLWLISGGRWVGDGDMYLGAGLALFLGDWRIAFVALFLANLIGTILALPKMLSGKLDRGTHVPFGPLLITGSLIAWFVGPLIVSWYQNIVF